MTGYVELHCHSNFSLLDGASHPEDLLAQAARLDMPCLALTDHDAVYGAARFARAAEVVGVRPVFGAELTTTEGHLTLLVENRIGWRNLCWLITQARTDQPKGEALLDVALLEGRAAGLVALSGCREGMVARTLLADGQAAARRVVERYADLFGRDSFFVELQHHLLPGDADRVEGLIEVARACRVRYVATNDVHYAHRDGHRLQDVLVCIRHNTTLEQSARLRRPNSEYYLKDYRRMAPLFQHYPDALARTVEVADRCRFELGFGLQDLPAFLTPAGMSAGDYLRKLCLDALPARYGDTSDEVRRQLDYELQVVERAGLSNYFLIVWDIVRFARQQSIRCQGRGSASGSLVAYLLGITPVDPLRHALVFERFLSDERRVAPDIDVDFDAARREEVIQYVYEKYGREHAAMACTFVTFQARSALRDVGRALGFPPALLDRAAKALDTRSADEIGQSPNLLDLLDEQQVNSPLWSQLFDLCGQIDGFPRHLGIHNGGMVVTGPPLSDYLPTEPAAMPGRTVAQWDKESLEDGGLVKIDLLGLRMLAVISQALDMIEQETGQRPNLDVLPFDDPAIYDLVRRADTIGVFQVESRAQAQVQPRLQARTFEDLVVSIALIRPGPIQGNMVHPYLRRRAGEEPVRYPHPKLRAALEETKGVVLFQEQVLRVAADLAGWSAGQGELLRRALGGAKNAQDIVARLEAGFVEAAVKNGVDRQTAQEVFGMLRAFAGYAFARSHAAAFAVLVYQSAFLKVYHPAPFYAALLNNQPMGFWSPAVIVNDARRHGITVLPVDVNLSEARCSVKGQELRLGLTSVLGVGQEAAQRIDRARQDRVFTSLDDFCQRTALPSRLVEHLIRAGAMDGWGIPRRKLLWELGRLRYPVKELEMVYPQDDVDFPAPTRAEALNEELSLLGLSTGDHPLALYRERLDEQGILTTADLRECEPDQTVRLAGLVVVHQSPPTAKGFHFITLEDESGIADVIVNPRVFNQYRPVIRGNRLLLVEGTIQRAGMHVNLLARRVEAL